MYKIKDIINKVHCADCLGFMKELPDNSVDLVVTSPPYDNLRDYDGYTFDFNGIAKELFRIVKEGGVVVWVVGDATIDCSETGTSFKQALYFKEIGFNLHDTMIYSKSVPPMNDKRYQHCFEYMFILVRGKIKTFNPIMVDKIYSDKRKTKNFHRESDGSFVEGFAKPTTTKKIKENIWRIFAGGGASDKIASGHPAIFPEQLAAEHIKSWSNKGDLVLDPMCGSGTTLKMARLLNRNFIGIEISEKYCKIARDRLRQQTLI